MNLYLNLYLNFNHYANGLTAFWGFHDLKSVPIAGWVPRILLSFP